MAVTEQAVVFVFILKFKVQLNGTSLQHLQLKTLSGPVPPTKPKCGLIYLFFSYGSGVEL